jgi:predicted glycosyltransferase
MRILIDIGHPAHVHYFKNFYRIMSEKGHDFLITARKKEVSHELLEAYNIPYQSRGKGSNHILGKILYLPKADLILLKQALRFKPDLFLSFSSTYAAQVSAILRKPHIALDDTEHAKLARLFYRPFTNLILSPQAYMGKRSAKQKFFNGYMELCYLHPNYFTPDESVLKLLNIDKNERYIVLRFVSWNANHDVGHSGISLENKRRAVKEFSKFGRVFISSEDELPKDLKEHQITLPPAKIHDV